MNKYAFLIILFVLFSFPPVISAEDIQTGNASAKSTVETNVQGSGSVTTHIEVEANGEKKVLDTNEPGSYSLSVESNNNSKASVNSSSNTSSSSTPSGTPDIDSDSNDKKSSFISTLVKNIRNFFERILDFF